MSTNTAATPGSTTQQQKSKSKRRKNVSIGFATWSRLRTHGIYGDSLDDILNRLMDKADELSRRDSKIASKPAQVMVEEQPQQRRERKLIEQKEFFRIFEKDIAEAKPGDRSVPGQRSIEIDIPLPGIKFPMDKTDLLGYAIYLDRESGYHEMAVSGFYYETFVDLPDKTYMNKENLEEALVVLSNTPGHEFFHDKIRKVVGFNLLTTKDDLEKMYHDLSSRQADEEFRKMDEYYGLDKEHKRKIIEEQKRKLMEYKEQFRKSKQEQEDNEQRELELQHEQEEGEREMEEAAVKDTVEKTFKPVKTDL